MFCVLLESGVFAAEVANHSANTNDRFADNSALISNPYDLSGVGRTSDGNWATRIGDNYYLTAAHFRPATNEVVEFYASNSPVASSYSYQTAGGFRIAGTDLWLGYFNESIDSSINTYGFNTTSANSLAEAGLDQKDVFMLGNSPTADGTYGGTGRLTDTVVAENRAESWYETGTNTVVAAEVVNQFADATGSPSNAGWDQIVTFKNLDLDNNGLTQRTHEGQLQGGDSGSPLFSVAAGQLQIEGIAYAVVSGSGLTGNFIDTIGAAGGIFDPFEQREASFYTYTGSLSSDLATAIGNVPVGIPEPSQVMMLLIGSGFFLKRRRR